MPETLFIRGKGIDMGFVEHALPTVPVHLPVWCKSMMCACRNQHEWNMLAHQNVDSDCEAYQSKTLTHPKHSEKSYPNSYNHE
jgi:hypothetical protein